MLDIVTANTNWLNIPKVKSKIIQIDSYENLVLFDKKDKNKRIPDINFCKEILARNDLPYTFIPKEARGGNGTVSFTEKLAVKRSVDLLAGTDGDEVLALQKVVHAYLPACKPKGFAMNLPTHLFQIYDRNGNILKCNIQVMPNVNKKEDMGDIVREYIKDPKAKRCLMIIEFLGHTLAKFQNPIVDKKSVTGLQHGDFNAGNILITEDKPGNLTLIDNANFNPRALIISDIVCFVYFTTILWGKEPPSSFKERIIPLIGKLYKGWVKKLPEDVCHCLKKQIFDPQAPGPLQVAQSQKDGYPKGFQSTSAWSDFFEHVQRKAFLAAYTKRFSEKNHFNEEIKLRGKEKFDNIDSIKNIKNITYADFSHTAVVDISPLSEAKMLKVLKLRHTPIAAIQPLEKLNALEELDLSHTKVQWVGPLSKISTLKKLNLSENPQISDASDFAPLEKLFHLRKLNLKDTHVSKERLMILHCALPKCTILS